MTKTPVIYSFIQNTYEIYVVDLNQAQVKTVQLKNEIKRMKRNLAHAYDIDQVMQ